MPQFNQQEIGPWHSMKSHICPKCGYIKWSRRWQVVTQPSDTTDTPTTELHFSTPAMMVVVENIPPEIGEVIVHTCDCGYFIVTKTYEQSITQVTL